MKIFIPCVLFVISLDSVAQTELFNQNIAYSRQDSLRGSITPERSWWDLKKYQLSVEVDLENKSLTGTNIVSYNVLDQVDRMQIDLQTPMQIVDVTQDGEVLEVTNEGNAHFIKLQKQQIPGNEEKLTIRFSGVPHEAEMAPWDGGFSWKKDSSGKPFIANANQGIGASLWWPCKDHGYDEPENGVELSITVPKGLIAVGNGRLVSKTEKNDKVTYEWGVINPINAYCININIGDYINFSEKYEGEKGILDMDYWVLRENEQKAREHFKEAKRTIEALEYWFGPYPFYEDSYKLIEVPYLGMEHQSSVTYGNQYKMGYNGRGREMFDFSRTGWGLKWDFIIVHETGHEWFANNITVKDWADIWVHEAFTSYAETLFTEYHFGKKAAQEYLIGTRVEITNQDPLIADYEVNHEGPRDVYFKGSSVLHTLRHVINDDEKFRKILRGLNKEFYHQTVTSNQIEKYISQQAGMDFSKFFDQYLRQPEIPTLEYEVDKGKIRYHWTNVIDGFEMPVKVMVDGNSQRISVTEEWQETSGNEISIDENFYVRSVKL